MGPRHDEVTLARRPEVVDARSRLERLGKDERLERRARLALALSREVERLLGVVAPADHRADLAGVVVDGDERSRRAQRIAEVLRDRGLRRLLVVEVERRLD